MDDAVKKSMAKRIAKQIINCHGDCNRFPMASRYCEYCPIMQYCKISGRFVSWKSQGRKDGKVTAARDYLNGT